MQQGDKNSRGRGSLPLNQIITASSIGFAILVTAATRYRLHRKHQMRYQEIIPRLKKSVSGHIEWLEPFSEYLARQIGIEDPNECLQLCKLANAYLRKTKDCESNIYEYFSNDPEADSLFNKLIEELDKCIICYFGFHWSQSSFMISQVLMDDTQPTKKLKNIVMAATRKQRFEKVTKDLKVTGVFSTLVTEMKVIGNSSKKDSHCTDVMMPVSLSERSPVLLLMGGGMGAGKSTVLKNILKESFWAAVADKAVIVEADAFKETNVIYRALSSRGPHDMLQTAELVHQSSTDAASSLLVTALNEGRDVIMDGTLAWEPFVDQTIAMARNVHRYRYRMGIGYKVNEDRTVIENYWEQVEDGEENQEEKGAALKRKPYRIELAGVICDPHLAVARGIRRAIIVGRAVRVRSQLKSHKSFSNAFPRYCQLVDNARLYCTNTDPPKLIAWKDGESNLLVDPQEIHCLKRVNMLNEDAESISELYTHLDTTSKSGFTWEDIIMFPSRACFQQELKIAIKKAENQT